MDIEDLVRGIVDWIVDNPYEAGFGFALFVIGVTVPLFLGLPQKALHFLLRKLLVRRRRLREALQMFGGSVELIDKHRLAWPASPQRIRQFYEGGMLAWDVIAAGADIERDKQGQLLSMLRAQGQALMMVCVVGASGCGKSTAAWRAAMELYRQSRALVLWVKRTDDPEIWLRLPQFHSVIRRHVYILVDDLFRFEEVVQALRTLDPSLPLTILATSQSAEYRPHHLTCQPLAIHLEGPSELEKTRMLKKLGKSQDDLTSDEQARLDRATDFRVMMMELTSGRDHVEAISETVRRLGQVDQIGYEGYKYVSFCYQYGTSVPVSVLQRLPPEGRFYRVDQRPAVQGLIFQDDALAGYLRAGHSNTAASAFNAYIQAPDVVLSQLVQAADEGEKEQRLFVAHLLWRVISTEGGLFVDRVVADIASALSSLAKHTDGISETVLWRKCLHAIGMTTEAEAREDALILMSPANSWECNMLVHVLRELGREREALLPLLAFMQSNPETRGMRLTLLSLVQRYGTRNQINDAIFGTRQWLAEHPDVSEVRAVFLGLVERQAPDMVPQVIEDTRQWLAEHPDVSNVRAVFLGLVERQAPDMVPQVIEDTRQWLAEHPDVSNVRAVFLGLVERQAPDMVPQVIEDTRQWLAEHPDVSNVRAVFLGLVERQAPDMVPQVIEDTRQWLAEHPDVRDVRTVFLGLVERQAPDMVPQVVEDTRQWLAEHPDVRDVRTVFLGLVERQAPDMVPQVVEDTRQWLAEHLDAGDVRLALLELVEKFGLEGERDKVGQYVQNIFADWQEEEPSKHLFDVVIGNKRLEDAFETQLRKAVDEYGVASIVERTRPNDPRWLVLFANWLRDHYDEQAWHIYEHVLNLNPAQTNKFILRQALYGYAQLHLRLGNFARAARLFKRTLETHKGHIAARVGLAEAFQELGNKAYQRRRLGARDKCFEKAKEELRHAVYWAGINKHPIAHIHGKLGWLFLSWEKNEAALKEFINANRQPGGENFANYWGQGQALLELGRPEKAEAALKKSLEIAPEGLTSPAKDEILELLKKCRSQPMSNESGLTAEPASEE